MPLSVACPSCAAAPGTACDWGPRAGGSPREHDMGCHAARARAWVQTPAGQQALARSRFRAIDPHVRRVDRRLFEV